METPSIPIVKQSQHPDPILQAVNVKKVFGRGETAVTAVKNIHLDIAAGSMVALKGRSGSGKTTLLNLLAALDQPTEGQVLFNGQELSRLPEKQRSLWRRSQLGLVFQAFGLIPLMSAYENVEFALRIAGTDKKLNKERAETALEWVGMKSRMKHRPPELSGGEQQRVAIARAIAHEPLLLLADEPTAELDSRMGLQVIKVFRDLVERRGMTVVMTTHDPGIMEIVDHVIALEDGEIVAEPKS
ncbi:ABC transporter ATP-binding protein [Paenibacillus nasutitermitis]|nr:ABC transporter ATP-binding protein [Paenibacillus nasutitermitis]